MSRHEGVSCDACLKNNFRGRRYKCLVCYDYDLCAVCYEQGVSNTRHTADHPVQCLLTRNEYEIYYGGETLGSLDMPQSYTCPYCSRMGFTEATLHEHVSSEHQDTASVEVVCPLCAAMPGGDPNLMTDDFASHLTLEHRPGNRDMISFMDEPGASRHIVRRMPHSSSHSSTGPTGRGGASLRPRRSNMHFSVFSSGSGLSSLSPSSRETVDPIAELLSQLSGVRRTANNSTNTPTQLQQLQMQLQLERQQATAARQNLEPFPRRPHMSSQALRERHHTTSSILLNSSPVLVQPSNSTPPALTSGGPSFLLTELLEEKDSNNITHEDRFDATSFAQELMLSSLAAATGQETSHEVVDRIMRRGRQQMEDCGSPSTNSADDETKTSDDGTTSAKNDTKEDPTPTDEI